MILLTNGTGGCEYTVRHIGLPTRAARHLEALGMITGTRLTLLQKKRTAMVIRMRGTRYALGRTITDGVEVEET